LKQTRNLKDLSETNVKLKGPREVFGPLKVTNFFFFIKNIK